MDNSAALAFPMIRISRGKLFFINVMKFFYNVSINTLTLPWTNKCKRKTYHGRIYFSTDFSLRNNVTIVLT